MAQSWILVFLLYYTCLFDWEVKSVSITINMCTLLCIKHRTNDVFCNQFQKTENASFKNWHVIVIETHGEHGK